MSVEIKLFPNSHNSYEIAMFSPFGKFHFLFF